MGEVGSRNRDGSIAMLGYTDSWGEREYLYTFTDICDRTGCYCQGAIVQCSNIDYILFVAEFWIWYADACEANCRCFAEEVVEEIQVGGRTGSSIGSSSGTWSSIDSTSSNTKVEDWYVFADS